jgi:hypothetical protein
MLPLLIGRVSQMSFSRAAVSVASMFLGLSAAFAQQEATTAAQPPEFQGTMVDAKGKTVGRLIIDVRGNQNSVVRQINKVWVVLVVPDLATGFLVNTNISYWYQSSDCTGQAYLAVNPETSAAVTAPAFGNVATIPPATQPAIYFAGAPASVVAIKSLKTTGSPICGTVGFPDGNPMYVGLPQSVPVSSLGLTLPFSVK